MSAELSQAEKSPVAVLTQGGTHDGVDGDNAVVVVTNERAKKRQSLSDVFTIVGSHCDESTQGRKQRLYRSSYKSKRVMLTASGV
jgi:hypothetical protein